eukprot:GEZU01040325.1.p1 GENE.GEZU01040325.1~~GEZU01040325.1.p1  ORF type:complete len:129 (-),score=8.06 GEZU01040325.1:78-410(-)
MDYDNEGSSGPSSIIPSDLRSLRACLSCFLVKTTDQFIKDGCENCTHLDMRNDKARVNECTSTSFEGLIGMMNPDESWVARWQGIKRSKKGVYAIAVYGDMGESTRKGGH